MGRYSIENSTPAISQNNANPSLPPGWPTKFPKPVVGLDRDGTIIEDRGFYITSPDQIIPIKTSLEAIRMLRLKGYKVVILSNQAGIQKGLQTQVQVDIVNKRLLEIFAEAEIYSIDAMYYATSNLKEDEYAKPNIGMFKRAEMEIPNLDFCKGWYVGDKISDLKAAVKAGAKPVLVKSGHGEETLKKLDTFANKDLSKDTKVFNNLLEFTETLD